MKRNLLTAIAVLAAAPAAHAEILISEIFYNLAGSESGLTEWVEVTNTGAAPVDLTGWFYADIQDNSFSNALPAGSIVPAGGSAVIVAQSAADFATIWGGSVQVINYTTAGGTGISLANAPSATNETVAILDPSNVVVDAVNFEANTNGWPVTANGASIYLLPEGYTTALNDVGSNWAISVDGIDGAYTAAVTNPGISNATAVDVASPGVAVFIPEPATALLAAVALAGVASRRA